jgi:HEXXH motif-containing protein
MHTEMLGNIPFGDVFDLLTWTRGDRLFDRLWAAHHDRSFAVLDELAQGSIDPHGMIAGIFGDLPAEHQERFVTAPEVYYRLNLARTDLGFFIGALIAETRLAGGRASVPTGTWTATGDWYFPGGATGAAVVVDSASFNPDRPYRAPTLGNGVPVDLISPYARRSRTIGGELVALDRDGAESAVATMVRAMDKVASVIPLDDQLHRRFIRTIVLQHHKEPRHFSSFSSDYFVGRTNICFGAERCDVHRFADALVHESIHAPLFLIAREFPFVRPDVDPAYKIKSPWTGRMLPADSFAHAIFVWLGLRQFWRKAAATDVFVASRVEADLTIASAGFEGTALEETLDDNAHVLAPDVIAAGRAVLHELRRGSFD